MSRKTWGIVLIWLFALGLITAVFHEVRSNTVNNDYPNPLTSGIPIHTGPTFDLTIQTIFGPNICTAYGDPFSPLNSIWAPGFYTYQYAIVIPPDYEHDLVRVELFDPDSINTAVNTATVFFSQTAIQYSLDNDPPDNLRFPAHGRVLNCMDHGYGSNPQWQLQPCVIETGEREILYEDPTITLDQINPYWFMRQDQNRGAGPDHGNGTCAVPSSYTPRYNTATVFELAYTTDELARVPLASYTGQVGDGIRDDGDHQTDMRWVSPGAAQASDYPVDPDTGQQVAVPTEFGSFEIDLTTDVANIYVDPDTGDRFIHLDITTISGASAQGFDIWAGPPQPDWASDGNTRRLQLVDNPHVDWSDGIRIVANGYAPRTTIYSLPINHPLLYVGPEFAGQTITVTAFDFDAGTQPPIAFLFDSLAFTAPDAQVAPIWEETDWGYLYGDADDPNTEGRCFHVNVGGNNRCTNQWITPAYTITIPSDDQCDYQNPTMESCTPFYGGFLHGRVANNTFDTYNWGVSGPLTHTHDVTVGCSAFPIAPALLNRSVTPPGTGSNPYPDPASFYYPPNPPAYEQFPHHSPDMPLSDTQPGTVYRVWLADDQANNFSFLRWNSGINATNQTLANSLAWPGNTRDYTDHGDGGQAVAPGYPHVVRGFVDYVDNTDLSLNIDNWVTVHTGTLGSAAVHDALNEHIDRGRLLRLPVSDAVAGSGNSARAQVHRFGLFRLHGYNLSAPAAWLLLEFAGWDDSCGQIESSDPPPPSITLAPTCSPGPNIDFTVTGVNWPDDRHITLYWNTTTPLLTLPQDQHDGTFAVPIALNNVADGSYEVTAVASDPNSVQDTAVFQVPCEHPSLPYHLYLPFVLVPD